MMNIYMTAGGIQLMYDELMGTKLYNQRQSAAAAREIENELKKYTNLRSTFVDEPGDTYTDLLETIQYHMQQDGTDAPTAVAQYMAYYSPKRGNTIPITDFPETFMDPNALTVQIPCGRIDCLKLPLVEQRLINDLGGPPSKFIVGIGGSRGSGYAKYQHGALYFPETDQYLGYFQSELFSPQKFQQYAQRLNWGEFGLSTPQLTTPLVLESTSTMLSPIVLSNNP
jgi:hypothetical protein